MKTALISLLTAVLLGFAAVVSGRPLDAADFLAIAFATGLVAWTVVQYRTSPAALTTTKPIYIPIKANVVRQSRPSNLQQVA